MATSNSVNANNMTNGQLIIGSTGVAPVVTSLTAGSGISITPGAGSISIAATAGVQPSFIVNNTTTLSNVTGNGTSYVPLFNSIIYDSDTAYNTGTGIYSLPSAGRWVFGGTFFLTGFSATTRLSVQLVQTNPSYSNETVFLNPLPLVDATFNYYSTQWQIMIIANAGCTAYPSLYVIGEASDTVDVLGSSALAAVGSSFWGYKIS